MITPPQKPLAEASSKLGLTFSPRAISSATEVNIIGFAAVPAAFILAPLAITSTEAFAPVPTSPLMIVPGAIVSVTPACTITLPFRICIPFASHVSSAVIKPESTITGGSSSGPQPTKVTAAIARIIRNKNFEMFFIFEIR